jgi:hypothetical protein
MHVSQFLDDFKFKLSRSDEMRLQKALPATIWLEQSLGLFGLQDNPQEQIPYHNL